MSVSRFTLLSNQVLTLKLGKVSDKKIIEELFWIHQTRFYKDVILTWVVVGDN